MRALRKQPTAKPGGLPKPCLRPLFIVIVVAVLACFVPEMHLFGQAKIEKPSSPSSRSKADGLGDRYLMLVNTASAKQMDATKAAQFDRSPYDGLAVSFSGAYDTSPAPSLAAMQSQEEDWKDATAKDIWPWVSLNRMIGANDEGNPDSKVPYFQRFPGLDLDGRAGAKRDFLEEWRNALRLAKVTGVPGIVCDLEFYNNYRAYDLNELARMTSRPRPEVIDGLRKLGAHMADIASAEYPGTTLWFLFTGFSRPDYRVIEGHPYYLAATYIVEGLLEEVQQRHFQLHVLSGGEVGLGYCHASVDDLRQAIEKRAAIFAPLLRKYPGILELAGTMTLWSERSAKKSWVAQGVCRASSAATVEDLVPSIQFLLRTYRYNWIYASPNGGYLAFDSSIAPRFDAAIRQALASAHEAASGRSALRN